MTILFLCTLSNLLLIFSALINGRKRNNSRAKRIKGVSYALDLAMAMAMKSTICVTNNMKIKHR